MQTKKEALAQYLEALLTSIRTQQADAVNGMMKPELVSINDDGTAVTFRYPVLPWESNRVGILHGGIITAMLDNACGLLASSLHQRWTPTLSLHVDFIRPANIHDQLLVTASFVSTGRHVLRLHGLLTNEKSGKTIAACSATFFVKEKND